jgi:hypothetical protein
MGDLSMSALSLLSIALLLAAIAGCVVLWNRSGETRVGRFGALFVLVAIYQSLTAWTNGNTPLGWNLATLGCLVGLAVGALGILTLVAYAHTLDERDRVEKLHWDSMETVRIIDELNESDAMSLDAKTTKLLEVGAARFGMPVGMATRIRADRYEVTAIDAPKGFPVAVGDSFPLEETFFKNVVDSERPVGIEQIFEGGAEGSRERPGFGAYLGAAIRIDGTTYGTLSFGSFEPRVDRFSGTEKDLIRLMAQCIGSEIARHDGAVTAFDTRVLDRIAARRVRHATTSPKVAAGGNGAAAVAEAPLRDARRCDSRAVERVIDPNRILRRIGNELRALAGDSVNFVMKLDPNLGFAAAQNVPLETIARTLVSHAREAMPDGGELVVESANLEIADDKSGQMPAVAPDRYVTISFRDSGPEPDPNALSRLFGPSAGDAAAPSSGGKLALSTVYRALQICGGDLSVKVEPGLGSTFTVFLPRARDAMQTARESAPARAPVVPDPMAR